MKCFILDLCEPLLSGTHPGASSSGDDLQAAGQVCEGGLGLGKQPRAEGSLDPWREQPRAGVWIQRPERDAWLCTLRGLPVTSPLLPRFPRLYGRDRRESVPGKCLPLPQGTVHLGDDYLKKQRERLLQEAGLRRFPGRSVRGACPAGKFLKVREPKSIRFLHLSLQPLYQQRVVLALPLSP